MRTLAALFALMALPVTPARGQETHVSTFPTAAVAADHELASQAGAEILKAGGNAVDAAVATSFALSVVRPYSCGIGGGGFMVIHLREHPRTGPITTAINYRETGPAWVSPTAFESDPDPDSPTHGPKAVCTPGTVAGLLYALEKYGTMPRDVVLAPAIRLAQAGFVVDAHYANTMHNDDLVLPWFAKDPARRERFGYLWDRFLLGGNVKVGDRVHAPEQASALRLIAEQGADAFYKGDIARAISQATQGRITPDDLGGYRVKETLVLEHTWRGMRMLTMPPPSSGGIVLAQTLAILDHRNSDLAPLVSARAHNSAPYIHLLAEVFKTSFADRARWMGDPDFVDVPTRQLLDGDYLRTMADAIDLKHTRPPETYGTPLPDDAGTSHLCVVDARGNAVACTETINLIFGSMVAVEEFGFILNDEMDDFLTRASRANAFGLDHAQRNRPQPGKRPLSSMTPTIVVDPDGAVRFIAGGAGGPRIISGTIQVLLNALAWDMPAGDAVAAPRFHHQWHPNRLELEPTLEVDALPAGLRALGHDVGSRKVVGTIQVIRRGNTGWEAASDPRKGGKPAGY